MPATPWSFRQRFFLDREGCQLDGFERHFHPFALECFIDLLQDPGPDIRVRSFVVDPGAQSDQDIVVVDPIAPGHDVSCPRETFPVRPDFVRSLSCRTPV